MTGIPYHCKRFLLGSASPRLASLTGVRGVID